jgi:hypothetical protein
VRFQLGVGRYLVRAPPLLVLSRKIREIAEEGAHVPTDRRVRLVAFEVRQVVGEADMGNGGLVVVRLVIAKYASSLIDV